MDYVGTVGAIDGYTTLPRWKGLGTLTWTSDPVELSLTGRFIDSMENRTRRRGTNLQATGVDLVLGPVRALVAGPGRGADGRRAQPLRPEARDLLPAIDANTDPSTYDVIGRRYWVGVRVRL